MNDETWAKLKKMYPAFCLRADVSVVCRDVVSTMGPDFMDHAYALNQLLLRFTRSLSLRVEGHECKLNECLCECGGHCGVNVNCETVIAKGMRRLFDE